MKATKIYTAPLRQNRSYRGDGTQLIEATPDPDPTWKDRAACAGQPAMMFPEDLEEYTGTTSLRNDEIVWQAAQMCANCPVTVECNELKVRVLDDYFGGGDSTLAVRLPGVWAGQYETVSSTSPIDRHEKRIA